MLLASYSEGGQKERCTKCQETHFLIFFQYDHLAFPGVVPRTFVGPIVVSTVAYPAVAIIQLLGLSKFIAQYIGMYQ